MESTSPKLRFVRCPKCLTVLAELQGIPLYKCGGCYAILIAKVHSRSGETLSSASAADGSKNISDGRSLDYQTANFGKQTSSASDHLADEDHAVTESLKVFGSSGERNVVEFSGGGIKSHVSESNDESLEEKGKSLAYEQNVIKGITLETENQTERGITTKTMNSLMEEVKISSHQEILAENSSLKSSDKLEESPESLEQDTTSEDNNINGKFRKDTSFLLRSSSLAYDGSVSSTDEERRKHIPQKYLNMSRRTIRKSISSVTTGKVTSRDGVLARERDISFDSEDFHSVMSWMESENDAPSRSKSKDTKQFVKLRYSERRDKVKIIRKVDELKNELLEFFDRGADGNEDSRLDLNAHFEGKVAPKQYRSSLIPFSKQPNCSRLHPHHPFSKQPNCSRLHPHHGGICCHSEFCRPCPHNACFPLPEGTTSRPLHMKPPLHMKRSPTLHKEPQNLQFNDKRPQATKRHCRPVSGGAPFVICYKCYNLLQLPADFLVSTKRVHRLRCGSCSEVLRYSFRPRTHSMPRTPAEALHPPSENENNEVLDDEIRAPLSKDLTGGDPVSFSEEFDFSFGKSNSYEAEPSQHLIRYDSIVEEERSGKVSGSQLHKLMGYSSARYLLFETLSAGEGHRSGQDR